MTTLIEHNEGKVIEKIDDEIMCIFNDALSYINKSRAHYFNEVYIKGKHTLL